MTFSLRRKLLITRRAAPRKGAATTISQNRQGDKEKSGFFTLSPCLLVSLSPCLLVLFLTAAIQGQEYITPRFVTSPRTGPTNAVAPVHYAQPVDEQQPIVPIAAQMPPRGPGDDRMDAYVRTELPGPQRLFQRESEGQFFERIAQDMKKQPGATRAIFPESPVISKEKYAPRRFESMPAVVVEPSYVCHRRLLFEQPNFERAGYNFGILQPAIGIGIFYYDLALMPYHACSNLHDLGDCSVGKCLPGDPAPMYLPRERFSVTGLLGQSASIVGLAYLFR